MADTIFRNRQESSEEKPQEEQKAKVGATTTIDTKVEVPYTEFQTQHRKPFLVEYFKLGELWNDKVGGFEEEIGQIEGYIREQIEEGEIENSLESARYLLKAIEKECNADRSERLVNKIAKMAAYADFLRKTKEINKNSYKYGQK